MKRTIMRHNSRDVLCVILQTDALAQDDDGVAFFRNPFATSACTILFEASAFVQLYITVSFPFGVRVSALS